MGYLAHNQQTPRVSISLLKEILTFGLHMSLEYRRDRKALRSC
jgi:hypothetical protein